MCMLVLHYRIKRRDHRMQPIDRDLLKSHRHLRNQTSRMLESIAITSARASAGINNTYRNQLMR